MSTFFSAFACGGRFSADLDEVFVRDAPALDVAIIVGGGGEHFVETLRRGRIITTFVKLVKELPRWRRRLLAVPLGDDADDDEDAEADDEEDVMIRFLFKLITTPPVSVAGDFDDDDWDVLRSKLRKKNRFRFSLVTATDVVALFRLSILGVAAIFNLAGADFLRRGGSGWPLLLRWMTSSTVVTVTLR